LPGPCQEQSLSARARHLLSDQSWQRSRERSSVEAPTHADHALPEGPLMVGVPHGDKRLVLLTGDGYEHRYVANALSARFRIERILVDRRSQIPNVRRAMHAGFGKFLGKAARSGFLRLIGDSRQRSLALRNLFGSKADAFDPSVQVSRVDGVNGPETVALL